MSTQKTRIVAILTDSGHYYESYEHYDIRDQRWYGDDMHDMTEDRAADSAKGRVADHGPRIDIDVSEYAGIAGAPVLTFVLMGYPHAELNAGKSGEKKQGTRLIKCECSACGYVCRTTSKWLEEIGAPLCPCSGERMGVA